MLDAFTNVYCIIGNPVRHSLSPIIHNMSFKRAGINSVYLAFEIKNLGDAIKGIKALGIKGVSITIPFKTEVIKYLDEVDPIAKKIKAANTILNRDGSLVGYNTDWLGAVEALREVTELEGKKALILGAGGASRAIAYGLISSNCQLIITNRSLDKAKKLAEEMGCLYSQELTTEVDIVINSTSVGMYPLEEESPLPKCYLKKGMIVMDIVYKPLKTKLLKEAAKAGCITIDGLSMLSYQAAYQFEIWTGIKPDISKIKEDLKNALERGKDERD